MPEALFNQTLKELARLANRIAAAEKACEDNPHKSAAITLLRRKAR